MEADEVDALFLIGAMFSEKDAEDIQTEALKSRARARR